MATYQELKFCKNCDEVLPAEKRVVNRKLHAALTVVTFGFWIPVWILITCYDAIKPSPFVCIKCNNTDNERIKKTKGKWKAWHIWVLSVCGLFATCTTIIVVTSDIPESSYQSEPKEQAEIFRIPAGHDVSNPAHNFGLLIAYRSRCGLLYDKTIHAILMQSIPTNLKMDVKKFREDVAFHSLRVDTYPAGPLRDQMCKMIKSTAIEMGLMD